MAVLFVSSLSFAQTTLFEDDIESFTAGDTFVENADQNWWTTWTPGSVVEDAVISSDYAHSGSNSVLFAPNDDVILKFGDRASGKYEISFWIYVESGQGGAYFNLQKYEEPGIEWAFNCVFNDDGTGNLEYSGSDHAFSFSLDQWVEIKNEVDLDNDLYKMYIDKELADEHQYSAGGENRLGCIDFYGDAGMDFYIDDVKVVEVIASTPPAAGVDLTEIITNGTANSILNLENTGVEDLYFHIYPTYSQTVTKSEANTNPTTVQLGSFEKGEKEEIVLQLLTGDVSYFTISTETERVMREVIKFTPEQLDDFGAIGTELNAVVCFVGETQQDGTPITDFKLSVYDREDLLSPGPGAVIAEKTFTPSEEYSQTLVTFDEPVYIAGRYLWFGFQYTDPGYSDTDTIFAFSYDGNESGMVEGSNWISLGVGWRSDVGGNLGLIGMASGTPAVNWLSVSPSNGSVAANDNEDITVSFDLTELATGVHEANLTVATNDPENTFYDLPVTLDVLEGIENTKNIGIMTYPNPTKDMLTIVSNYVITNITATNINGQQVYNSTPNSEKQEVNIDNLPDGIYMFTIKTENQTVTKKIIVK